MAHDSKQALKIGNALYSRAFSFGPSHAFSMGWQACGYRLTVSIKGIQLMRPFRLLAVLLPSLCALPLHAQQFANTCHASSSYDVTLKADGLVFDRAAPAPLRVELQQGAL